uniref:TNF family profile domain-containing protein n=1 Tax=Knipowitschia caucasica TaxID=637954 RepID=A0AAV2KTD3_KNICA
MDASRKDVESCAALHKHTRGSRLTLLLVALQTLVLSGCLLTGLCVYWSRHDPRPGTSSETTSGTSSPTPELRDDVHIQFFPISDVLGNSTLKFEHVLHRKQMDLINGSHIFVHCDGPYVVHMYVCFKSTEGQANGTLQLGVADSEHPHCTFPLQTHQQQEVCRGLHGITYLRAKNDASLKLVSTHNFRIKNITVGFNYLLGSRCEY